MGQTGISYSIAIDRADRFRRQSVAWLATATRLAGIPPEQILVQCADGVTTAYRDELAGCFGVRVVPLLGPTADPPPLNKLRQFDQPALDGDQIVLCDCDLAFAAPIPPGLPERSLAAKLVDIGFPEAQFWTELLGRLGIPLGESPWRRASRAARDTYRNNVNGGLYIGSREVWQGIAPAWRSATLELLPLMPRAPGYRYHVDQIAFAVTCARLRVEVELLPEEFNFPLHLSPPPSELSAPVILHHHQDIASGALRCPPSAKLSPGAVLAVARINDVLAEVDWASFGLPIARRRDD